MQQNAIKQNDIYLQTKSSKTMAKTSSTTRSGSSASTRSASVQNGGGGVVIPSNWHTVDGYPDNLVDTGVRYFELNYLNRAMGMSGNVDFYSSPNNTFMVNTRTLTDQKDVDVIKNKLPKMARLVSERNVLRERAFNEPFDLFERTGDADKARALRDRLEKQLDALEKRIQNGKV